MKHSLKCKKIDLPPTIIVEKDIVTEILENYFYLQMISRNLIIFNSGNLRNKHCNEINNKVIKIIPGTSRTYISVNNLIAEN